MGWATHIPLKRQNPTISTYPLLGLCQILQIILGVAGGGGSRTLGALDIWPEVPQTTDKLPLEGN